MRDQDQLLKERQTEFIDRFRANFDRCHVNHHLRTRPMAQEWLDTHNLLVHLNNVEVINEMDIRCLKEALGVQSYLTIKPLHLNRMRVSIQCQLTPRPPERQG